MELGCFPLFSRRRPSLPASLLHDSAFGHVLCGRGLEEMVSVLIGGPWDSESKLNKGNTEELSDPRDPQRAESLTGFLYLLLIQSS